MTGRRWIAVLFVLVLSIGGIVQPAAVYADCLTPIPTATPVPSYSSTLIAISPSHLIAYWKLDETAGTTAADSSGHSRTGSYSGVTLNATTFLNGDPAASFDGIDDDVNIYSSSLASAFSGTEGTLAAWVRVNNSAVWTSGTTAYVVDLRADASNRIVLEKASASNSFLLFATLGGVNSSITKSSFSSTSWFHLVITWSKSSNQVKAYVNGTQTGSTLTGLGTWTGSLNSTNAIIGALDTSNNSPWPGNISNVAVWDTALGASDVTTLATVSGPSPTATPQPTCTPSPTLTPTNTFTPSITPSNSPSPTLTPSNTPTPSNTANIFLYWTLPPPASTGTALPGQIVRFDYKISAGQAADVLLLAALLMSLLAISLILLLMRRR